MPRETFLEQLMDLLAGSVASAPGVASIIITGLGLAFGEGGGGMPRMLWIVFGLFIVVVAPSLFYLSLDIQFE